MGSEKMKECVRCKQMKNETEFPRHRFGISSTCKECTLRAKERLVVESKSKGKASTLGTGTKPLRTPQKRSEGQVHKRCPSCRAHVYASPFETEMICWKCDSRLKIIKALRDSTLHRGGIILRVVE